MENELNAVLNEENLSICKICLKLKKRIQDGQYNKRDKRWKDDDNLLWSGKVCGSCNRERAKEVMRKKRSIKKPLDKGQK